MRTREIYATATLLVLVLTATLLLPACGKSVRDTIDDATITTRVKTAFINDPVVGGMRIDVDTFKGVVTLSGAAKSQDEEQKAIQVARTVRGVVEVRSTLRVQH